MIYKSNTFNAGPHMHGIKGCDSDFICSNS